MKSEHWEAFQEAYAPAVLVAVQKLKPVRKPGETEIEYVVDVAALMLAKIEKYGTKSVEHYLININGGAFRAVGVSLGIPGNAIALQDFLDGR